MNLFEKIWAKHVVCQEDGFPAVLAIDFALLHEVTSAQAFDVLKSRNLSLYDKNMFLATIDHSVPTCSDRKNIKDETAKIQVDRLRQSAKEHDLSFYDFDSNHQGIVHVIGPELGATHPGMTLVCGDSHTSTHGAFGALAFGIGTSVLSHVSATGCLLMRKPKSMRVSFNGRLKPGVFAKDAILKLISQVGVGGANGHVIEYTGEMIENLSMEERMTLCNMSIECGAIAGLIAPDATTFEYLKDKSYSPKTIPESWVNLKSDSDAQFDKKITIEVDSLNPMVTWGTNPGQGIEINQTIPETANQSALEYVQLKPNQSIENTKIDWAFVGSCTNGRIEDLRIAAKILKTKKVHPEITFYIVPGSEKVLAQAKEEGLDKIFKAAGADFRMPGCSMCLGMNDDKVPTGKRCISSTNRNFVGRQGPGSITHLGSPAMVAASSIVGKIVSPLEYFA